jgi:hypothetical protein
MSSNLDAFLDEVDKWKQKLHEEMKGMSPAQRLAYWRRVHEAARARGMRVAERQETAKPTVKKKRRTA